MCASQQPGGVARIVALGVMLLLPFSIAYILFKTLRRAGGGTAGEGAPRQPSADAGAPSGMRELNP